MKDTFPAMASTTMYAGVIAGDCRPSVGCGSSRDGWDQQRSTQQRRQRRVKPNLNIPIRIVIVVGPLRVIVVVVIVDPYLRGVRDEERRVGSE